MHRLKKKNPKLTIVDMDNWYAEEANKLKLKWGPNLTHAQDELVIDKAVARQIRFLHRYKGIHKHAVMVGVDYSVKDLPWVTRVVLNTGVLKSAYRRYGREAHHGDGKLKTKASLASHIPYDTAKGALFLRRFKKSGYTKMSAKGIESFVASLLNEEISMYTREELIEAIIQEKTKYWSKMPKAVRHNKHARKVRNAYHLNRGTAFGRNPGKGWDKAQNLVHQRTSRADDNLVAAFDNMRAKKLKNPGAEYKNLRANIDSLKLKSSKSERDLFRHHTRAHSAGMRRISIMGKVDKAQNIARQTATGLIIGGALLRGGSRYLKNKK